MDRTFYFCFNETAGTAFRISALKALTAYHTLHDKTGSPSPGDQPLITFSVFDQYGVSHEETWRIIWYCDEPDVDAAVIELQSEGPGRDGEQEEPRIWQVDWRERESDWYKDPLNAPSIEAFLPGDQAEPCCNPIPMPIPGECIRYERESSKLIQYSLKAGDGQVHYRMVYNGASGSPAHLASATKAVGVVLKWDPDGLGHFYCVKTAAIAQRWGPLRTAITKWEEGESKVREKLGAETLATLQEALQKFSDAGVPAPRELKDLVDLVQAALLLPLDGYGYRSSDMVDMVLGKDWKGVVYDHCPTIQAFFHQIGQQVAARRQAQDLYWEEPPNPWFKRLWWRTPWAQLERLNRAKVLYDYSRVGRMHQ
jgi:hypothetical protein